MSSVTFSPRKDSLWGAASRCALTGYRLRNAGHRRCRKKIMSRRHADPLLRKLKTNWENALNGITNSLVRKEFRCYEQESGQEDALRRS